ncbi:peroxidase family protein [Sphingomonas aerolata]|uniref:peroxidase family protein n=1 Tax=Sphingomonas aerolata TaxID=185951 RepID=UPI002FE3C742
MSGDFTVDLGDLNFILAQIRISERNAAGESLADILGPQAQLIPYGLRTVDGSYNNLLPGNAVLGAADQLLPRLTTPVFRNLNDGATFGTGPGGPVLTNTDYGTPGSVVDADPRLISNLIADMTNTNPAAIAAWYVNAHAQAAYADAHGGDAPPDGYIPTNEELASIPNLSPDIGLSPSFNAWMTFFGQFFDHGLDLITKGGNGTVLIPLQPDDPLYVPGGPNFMPLTRSTQYDANGNPVVGGTETVNTTTPFIDQNQTYTSHASHQVFLREYKFSVDSDGDGVKDLACDLDRAAAGRRDRRDGELGRDQGAGADDARHPARRLRRAQRAAAADRRVRPVHPRRERLCADHAEGRHAARGDGRGRRGARQRVLHRPRVPQRHRASCRTRAGRPRSQSGDARGAADRRYGHARL